MAPEDFAIPFPGDDGYLDIMLQQRFVKNNPWVFHVQDFTRMSAAMKNAFMSILQERTVGGTALNGLDVIIADTNPREPVEGERMMVTPMDPALASRFQITISVNFDDFPIYEHLLDKYGETIAGIVIQWHQEFLNDRQRFYANARVLDAICGLIEQGMEKDLELALPPIAGDLKAPVPLEELKRKIAGREIPRLRLYAENIDYYVDILEAQQDAEAAGKERTDYELVSEILLAFSHSQLTQLVKYEEQVVRLLAVLPSRVRMATLAGATADRMAYWTAVFFKAFPWAEGNLTGNTL
jgi:hypothetical protein